MLFDEGYITSTLARVCNGDGATLGTAFFVLPSQGVALTCHHLMPDGEFTLLDCGDGKLRPGRVAQDDRFPEIDLAIIREVDVPHGNALPIVSAHQDISRFWTKGFHYYGREIVDALPTSGRVEGETSTKFSTPGKDYELRNVLLLKTSLIDAGLSGAPVIDPDSGVAFALVNAKFGNAVSFGGLALPFAQAQEHSLRLKELFEANANAVPRFGKFLNRLGALKILQLQRESVINRLVSRGFYLPDMYCERSEQDVIASFYASQSSILPIIGNAGVGKTMLLAAVARQPESKGALLMLGRDLRPDETELSLAINSRLREHPSNLLGPKGDVSLLISSLTSSQEQFTVILDGLNEIPATVAQSVDGWLDRSITWLEETNSRLIVSSRPEYWQTCVNLFPSKRVYRESTDKNLQPGLPLGDFSADEASRVKELYSLSSTIPIHHLRHPLIARIYLELESEAAQGKIIGTTRYQALQRFIKQKCDRIARAVGQGIISSHVELCLVEAARVTLETGQLELENNQYFGLFMKNAALADQFVHEGLFMTTSEGKRFSFDEVAEFVQSKILDFDTIRRYFTPNEVSQKLTTGAILFAILRLDEERKTELVAEAINSIVAAHTLFSSETPYYGRRRVCESVLAQLVQQIQNPERFTAAIETYATRLAAAPAYRSSSHDRFGFRVAIGRSGLPLNVKVRLLRMFLLNEDSYDFEHHHWRDLERYVIRGRGHTGAILAELIQSSPMPAFEALTEWLTDSTRLREAKSTVADAGIAMMFFYRHLAFEPLCELIARSETQKGHTLLTYIAENDPLKIVNVCLAWIKQEDPLLLKHSTLLATYIAGRVSDDSLDDKLYEVFIGVMGRVSHETNVVATKGISRLKKYRDGVIAELISFFKRGEPEVSGYALAELAFTHFDEVILAIRESIKSNAEGAGDAICALLRQPRSPQELNAVMALVESGVGNGLLDVYSFRLAIELLLFQSKDADPKRVMDLVRHVIGIKPEIRLHLRYFACGLTEHIGQREFQDQVLELLIATGTAADQEELLHHLIESGRYQSEDLQTFLTLGEKMPLERFHHILLSGAYIGDRFAKTLIDWLQLEGGIAPFGPTQTLIDRVRRGESGPEAVADILNDLLES